MCPRNRIFFAVLVLLVHFSTQHTQAQTKIDSLISARAMANHDSSRISIDILLGTTLRGTNFDSALFYLNRAITLARTIVKDHPKYEPEAIRALGMSYVDMRQKEKGIDYLVKAMSIQKQKGLKKGLSFTQFDLAYTYQGMTQFETAILHYDSIIARNVQDGTSHRLARSYNYSGLCNYYLRRLDKSSVRILEAIRYRKATGDTARIHYPYMVYGLLLKEQNLYEEAKDYIRQSGEIARLNGAKRRVALAYTNIGQILIKQDSLDAALESLTNAWEINKEVGYQWGTVSYYDNASWIMKMKGDYQQAHDYIALAIPEMAPTAAQQSRGDVYGSFAEAKILLADSVYRNNRSRRLQLLREAIPFAEEGWKLASQANSGNVKLKLSEILASLYSKLNRYQKAFEFSQISKSISEEINDQARTNAIARMNTEFETERIEGQNSLLQETQRTQKAQLKQQNSVIIGAIVVLFLIVLIAIVINRGRQRLQKANTDIEKSLSEKELLLKEIHHRVKNNLQVVSSLLDLQSRDIDDEKALSTFMEGQNRVKAMALIHQKLYQNEDLATIDFADYAEQLMKELASIYPSAKGVKTAIRAKKSAQFDIDTAIPLGLILNELISNAYKYAFRDQESGELNVVVEALGDGKHQLIVTDNGIGLPTNFDFDKTKSLGLRLVRRLSKQLYGKVEYSGVQGAQFVVSFTETLQHKAV